jgi:hypothetical protein
LGPSRRHQAANRSRLPFVSPQDRRSKPSSD